jgi:hypothetical protein
MPAAPVINVYPAPQRTLVRPTQGSTLRLRASEARAQVLFAIAHLGAGDGYCLSAVARLAEVPCDNVTLAAAEVATQSP